MDHPHAFWGGGEPTLSPAFSKEARGLAELGFFQTVNSNCTRYSLPLAELLENGSRTAVVCSIDAGSRNTYERIKGRDRWSEVWRNVHAYREASEYVVLKYIVLPENRHETGTFLRKAISLGISRFLVDLDCGLSESYEDPHATVLKACEDLVNQIETYGLHIGWAGNAFNTLGNRRFAAWLLEKKLPQPWIYFPFSQLMTAHR